MILAAHQPQYIPWLGYFDKIARCDAFVILDRVQYKEREYQNRNRIRAKNGPLWLTVPVVSKGRGREPIGDVRIDNSRDWARTHLLSIKAAYSRAPFFKDHLPFFEALYSRPEERLSDLNFRVIKYILKEFSIATPVHVESRLGITTTKTDRLIDICRKLGAGTYLSGAGGKEYLDEEKFPAAGVKLVYQEYAHPAYAQQFMAGTDDFLPFMSAIDLLFNEGPRAKKILQGTLGGKHR